MLRVAVQLFLILAQFSGALIVFSESVKNFPHRIMTNISITKCYRANMAEFVLRIQFKQSGYKDIKTQINF